MSLYKVGLYYFGYFQKQLPYLQNQSYLYLGFRFTFIQ